MIFVGITSAVDQVFHHRLICHEDAVGIAGHQHVVEEVPALMRGSHDLAVRMGLSPSSYHLPKPGFIGDLKHDLASVAIGKPANRPGNGPWPAARLLTSSIS
ncbi:MAG: hypothetical protein U0894_12425 [Pirellulales bacterium]